MISKTVLDEYYTEKGEYSAKFLIEKSILDSIVDLKLEVRDADGKIMKHSFSRWGSKIMVDFEIDDYSPDGLSIIDISIKMIDSDFKKSFGFWVVK